VLPPNINAALGLPTIHAYDSLSSRRYQAFVAALGGETTSFGRHNRTLGARFDTPGFALSGIALVLSRTPLASPRLREVERVGDVRLYRSTLPTGCCVRLARPAPAPGSELVVDALAGADRTTARLALDRGDRLEIALEPRGYASVLVLPRAWHPQVRAVVLDGTGLATAPTATFPVNGFLQGVAVPAGASAVRLEFLPWVRWSWLGHLAFLLLLAACAARWILQRRRATDPKPA
jgi:hypothetical protein